MAVKLKHRNIETYYVDTGGDGTPFLLVHGFTGSSLDFLDELDSFSIKRRTLLLDQRGHGETTNSASIGDYNLDTLVADLISFIETLGLPPLDILGHSLGGMVVMRAVLLRPELFRSLILMDTAAEQLDTGPSMPDKIKQKILDNGVQVLKAIMKQATPTQEVQNGIDQVGESEHWRRIEQKLEQMDPMAFFGLTEALGKQTSVLADLSRITCPTTIIVGAADAAFITPSNKMAKAIKHAKLITIPDAAHCPQYENRDAWVEAIEGHFAAL